MNHIYRSIWSEALATWIAVSENSKAKGKASTVHKKVLATTTLLLCSSSGWALPTGEQVVAGQVHVATPSTSQMQINQSSQQAIVNWQGFSINPIESVNIQQPNTSATLLNRVVGMDASVIQGQLNANGQVYLVNPNGVLFSKTAQVDVGGLVATTHSINNADFLNGNLHFTQNNASGNVDNQGYIKTPEGGVVALIGTQVSNNGTIETPKGSTILAAGKTVDLDFKGDGLVEVKVPEAALNAQVENKGAILADGGRVVLTAKSAGDLVGTVLNSEGIVQARGLAERNGEIILDGGNNGVTQVSGTLDVSGQSSGKITVTGKDANINAGANLVAQASSGTAGTIKVLGDMDNGVVNVAGKLDASAPKTGDGGFIETSAAHVKVTDSAKITTNAANGKTGSWLIDPFDFTIAASGGDITGSNLSTMLSSNSVTVSSVTGTNSLTNLYATTSGSGDVNVNDVVNWSKNLLTLNAERNININANLNGSGTAQLALQYGRVNGGVDDNYFINNGAKVSLPAGANFSTQKGSDVANLKNYTVITTLGSVGSTTGTDLQGMNGNPNLNYALGANIDASVTKDWNFNGTVNEGFLPVNGFIGTFEGLGHTITGLTINRPTATGNVGVFADAGYSNGVKDSLIRNVGLIGASITGNNIVGGLVGNNYGSVNNAYTTGSVNGSANVGGLVGKNTYSTGKIENSYSTVSVTATGDSVGGLVGYNYSGGTINNSYATGNVTGINSVGGLVGHNSGEIKSSYASGDVGGNATNVVGGLVGYNGDTGSISNSYATGNVTGNDMVGGLVGSNKTSISNTYATGNVRGTTKVGGLVGENPGIITNSFWDKVTTGQATSPGSSNTSGKTTAELMSKGTYSDPSWDFTNTWWMSDGNTRPFLQMEYQTNITNAHQLQLMAMKLSANYTLDNNIDLTTDLANPSGMWGTQNTTVATGITTGFVPIGDATTSFTGNFDGLGHTITGLTVNRPTIEKAGLFGFAESGTISNIGLVSANIVGGTYVGALVGYNNSIINNAYATGNVSATNPSANPFSAGGLLVGFNNSDINNAHATGNVTGDFNAGGLVGFNDGHISDSYAEGSVTGNKNVGGLIGLNNYGTVSNSHYDVGSVSMTVNGQSGNFLTVGGLYSDQYIEWFKGKSLNIDNYFVDKVVQADGSVIYGINNLQDMRNLLFFADNPAYKFLLKNDLNLADTTSGFFIPYLGTEFDGNNFTIDHLKVTQPDNSNIGMFGQGRGATDSIKNLKLANVDVTGFNQVGGLAGDFSSWDNTISNSSVTGKVTGNDLVGGLVGFVAYAAQLTNSVSNSYAAVDVTGHHAVGGLVGDVTGGTIFNSYATGNVTANSLDSSSASGGGLVGVNAGTIKNSYATGNVTGTGGAIGGLVGENADTIKNSYATGIVEGDTNVGGLVGLSIIYPYDNSNPNEIYRDSLISNAYATGNVTGSDYVGGLVGQNQGQIYNPGERFNSAIINNTYATGITTGSSNVGGLVGASSGTSSIISNSFWNIQSTSLGIGFNNTGVITNVVGKTSAEMMQLATFSDASTTNPANWSIRRRGGVGTIWRLYEGHTMPLLTSFLKTLILTDAPDEPPPPHPYNGTWQFGSTTSINDPLLLGTAATGFNAGFYNGYYSTQQGYDITGGNLSITPVGLTIIGLSGSRSYDGTTAFDSSILTPSGIIGSDNIGLSGIGYVSSANVGSYTGFTSSTLALSNHNYSLTGAVSVEITKALLNIKANDASKTYGQTLVFNGTEFSSMGLKNGETIGTVSLASEGANATASIENSPYDITATDAKGGTFLATNYNISYQKGKLDILNSIVDNTGDNNIISKPDDGILGGVIAPPPPGSVLPIAPAPGTEVEHLTLNSAIKPPLNDISDDFGSKLNIETRIDTHTDIRADIKADAGAKPPLNIIPGQNDNRQPIIQPTLTVANSAGQVKHLQISGNKQFLSLLLEDGSVRVWDFQRGLQRQIAPQDNQFLTAIGGVDDRGELLSIASKAGISAYDVISSSADTSINKPDVKQFAASNDGSLLLISSGTNALSLWNNQQNRQLWQSSYQRGDINNLALTTDKRYGAVLSHQPGAYMLPADLELKQLTDAVDIVDLNSGKVIKSLPNLGEEIIYMQFKDNNTLQLGLANGEMLNWAISNDSPQTVGTLSEAVTAMDIAKDTYAYLLKDSTVRVGDGQGQVLFSIKNKENPFQHAILLEEGKKLLTVMANGDLSLWDVASGKKMLRLFSMQEGGWTVMDAFGRFDGSEEALENITWLADEEKIPLDNFSENYYEPGLLANVLQKQDYLNSNLNPIKEGISLPPKVNLQLADQQVEGDKVRLQLEVYDRGGGIDKIYIYHNGKVVNNENAIVSQKILEEGSAEHRIVTLDIIPSAGKNTLKVTASNDMGIENDSTELSFDGKTKAYASAIKLLTVGINQYKDQKLNLSYSVADAELIGEVIKNRAKITTSKNLYDKNATKPKILAELKEISQGAQQDVLVIYFAGHGIVVGKEWYFLPYETKVQTSLEKIAESGITATELSEIFKKSKIQHVLLMVDSCYSSAGMDAFSKLENGQRYFTRQLSRSLGITVITAAARDQGAAELKSLGHGLFTYLMTQELQANDNASAVTAHSIAQKITKALPVFSRQVAGYVQEPAAYTHGNDFILTDVLKKTDRTSPDKPRQ